MFKKVCVCCEVVAEVQQLILSTSAAVEGQAIGEKCRAQCIACTNRWALERSSNKAADVVSAM